MVAEEFDSDSSVSMDKDQSFNLQSLQREFFDGEPNEGEPNDEKNSYETEIHSDGTHVRDQASSKRGSNRRSNR